MSTTNKIIGSLALLLGVGIQYINYFIFRILFGTSEWITKYINAPQEVTWLLSLVGGIVLGGTILTLIVASVICWAVGIRTLMD